MKRIQPVKTWYNGVEKNATILSAFVSSDNLSNSASIFYQLFYEFDISSGSIYNLEQIASGNLTMQGEDYNNWETNDYAYDWIAQQLNLIITGEYVPSII